MMVSRDKRAAGGASWQGAKGCPLSAGAEPPNCSAASCPPHRQLTLMAIHPTAIVDPGAQIDDSAEIGPFCVVGAEVSRSAHARGSWPMSTRKGRPGSATDNLFYPFSTVGVASQDLKYEGERAETHIGNRT